MKMNKKICILALILLIIAGIVVVALKGFNVSLMSREHSSVDIVIGKKFELKDVDEICKKVFGNKEYVLRTVEVFSDAININSESFTDDELNNLVTEFNGKFGLELKREDLEVQSNSNIRIRDMVYPYILPGFVSMVLITIYFVIIFRKESTLKVLLNLYGLLIITVASLASIVAIARIPFSSMTINILVAIVIVELVYFAARMNKNYKNVEIEKSSNK